MKKPVAKKAASMATKTAKKNKATRGAKASSFALGEDVVSALDNVPDEQLQVVDAIADDQDENILDTAISGHNLAVVDDGEAFDYASFMNKKRDLVQFHNENADLFDADKADIDKDKAKQQLNDALSDFEDQVDQLDYQGASKPIKTNDDASNAGDDDAAVIHDEASMGATSTDGASTEGASMSAAGATDSADRSVDKVEQKRALAIAAGHELAFEIRLRRLQLGITIADLANEFQLSTHMLKKLEAGEYDSLPDRVYVVGFLKLLAQKLQFNAEWLIDIYDRETSNFVHGDPVHQLENYPLTPRSKPRLFLIILAVILVAVAWYSWQSRWQISVSPENFGLRDANQQEQAAAPTTPEAEAPAKAEAAPAAKAPAPKAAAPKPAQEAAPRAAAPAASQATSQAITSEPAATVPATNAAGPGQLMQIRALVPLWARINDQNGNVIFDGVLGFGETKPIYTNWHISSADGLKLQLETAEGEKIMILGDRLGGVFQSQKIPR